MTRTDALDAAVWSDIRGPVNIAPSGALSLSRILRMGGPAGPTRFPIRCSARRSSGLARGSAPGRVVGDAVRLLRFGRGVDNTPHAPGARIRAQA